MCTTFVYRGNYYGRNMDIDTSFGEKLVAVPQDHTLCFPLSSFKVQNALLGVASVVDDIPLFAEAVNESGLYMAGLNFPHHAFYPQYNGQGLELAPYEVIPYFLSQYQTVAQARESLNKLRIVNQPFSEKLPLAPLHFLISDGKETIILEPTQSGLNLYNGVVPVLTNNPSYSDQLANLQRFYHLSPKNAVPVFLDIPAQPYGEGLGLIGLPGDPSPSSRFAKVTYLKHWMEQTDEVEAPNEVLRLLDQVAMERGSVITAQNRKDITRYSICYDHSGRCWWKTYDNPAVFTTDLTQLLSKNSLVQIDLYRKEKYQEVK